MEAIDSLEACSLFLGSRTVSPLSAVVDRINLNEMRKASAVWHCSQTEELSQAERAALDRDAVQVRGKRSYPARTSSTRMRAR